MAHIPVLLNEVLEYLDPKPGENFIDCTVGDGGHALAILKMTAPSGMLLGIDRDAEMVKNLYERAESLGVGERLLLHHGNFADLGAIVQGHIFGPVSGVLFDFGLSSWQLDESGAGFSFRNIEPLDMRFDRTRNTETAADILNSWPEEALERVIREFGEERYARQIAKEIASARKRERIQTTDQLVGIILRAAPSSKAARKIHFATRTFQALRIAVNEELRYVEEGIKEGIEALRPGGKIAAISFHSLEDRIVKHMFQKYSKRAEGPAFAPPASASRRRGEQSRGYGEAGGSPRLKIITKTRKKYDRRIAKKTKNDDRRLSHRPWRMRIRVFPVVCLRGARYLKTEPSNGANRESHSETKEYVYGA
ncbi:MAG: 16S rRNA (cytosine(1402)-N(4))-methyltransferase RsmH [Candidatus Spechtbacteria bacterium]|nr:16S rRNA (cytosine(1402)-N(4))-methyltransferase RsmH [Candidatus Spechtbacteria bacterium]